MTAPTQAAKLSLAPLLLRQERKRERTYSTDTLFSTVEELFNSILKKYLDISKDTSVVVSDQEGLIGTRDETPFVLLFSTKDVKGQGSYGIVYKGKLYRDLTNVHSYDDVAIKIPHDSDSHEEFHWEILVHQMLGQMLPTINNIQKVLLTYNLGIVSALRTGTSDLIVPRPYPQKEKMFKELIIAHSKMKNSGFYYTDNKPENILLVEEVPSDSLEIVDLSSASYLPAVEEENWDPSYFKKVWDDDELALSVDMSFVHNDLWERLCQDPKETYKDYIEFKNHIEHLLVYSLLVTFFKLITNEKPNDNPLRSICPRSPVRKNALELLTKAGCPAQTSTNIVSLLHLEKPLTLDTLLSLFDDGLNYTA